MKLDKIIVSIQNKTILGDINKEIPNIVFDSRCVKDGDMFIALKGFTSDGHNFLDQAVNNGAGALVVQSQNDQEKSRWMNYFEQKNRTKEFTMILVPDTRYAMAYLADAFYKKPSGDINLFGVTGTNGKTTTCYLLCSILREAKAHVGWVTTIDYNFTKEIHAAKSSNTTPESLDLIRILSQMRDNGIKWGVIEVSSHGLALHRVLGLQFNAVLYTNITRDHIDFHQDFSNYSKSKARLFEMLNESPKSNKVALINSDDSYADFMFGKFKGVNLSYGIEKPSDIMADQIKCGMDGLSFRAKTPWGIFKVRSPLLGRYNVYNILCAIGASMSQGINLEDVLSGIEKMRGAKGRFEKVSKNLPFDVIIDYAHSDDALEKLLMAAREITKGRLILVFGCGGNRDKSKRPLMGAVAAKLSDYTIITTDNSRLEEVSSINNEIIKGYLTVKECSLDAEYMCEVILDRREAIAKAISMAKPQDMVIVAGKGHESEQIIGRRKIAFNDRDCAVNILKNLEKRSQKVENLS